VLVCLLFPILTVGLRQNNQPWVEASRAQREIVTAFQRISPRLHTPSTVLVEGLPDQIDGVFVFAFGIGAAHALNLSTGMLPTYRYQPNMSKTAYEFHYKTGILPWRIITPEGLRVWVWPVQQKVLSAQGVPIPSWITDNPFDYDYHLRWDPNVGRFEMGERSQESGLGRGGERS
jgi:hypothetical protein